MDTRRLFATVYAYLVEKHDREQVDEWLAEPFDSELTDEERRRAEYRRKARELGISMGAERGLMDAFGLAGAG